MLKEFKEFAVKGNAVDLAVGVIIGAAFGGIVNSLVKDILMPPVGLLTGGLDFSNKFLILKGRTERRRLQYPSRRGQGRRGDLELRKFHYSRDQFHHRRLLHFPRGQSDEQVKKTVARWRARFEGVPSLCDDDPDQGDTLSALYE